MVDIMQAIQAGIARHQQRPAQVGDPATPPRRDFPMGPGGAISRAMNTPDDPDANGRPARYDANLRRTIPATGDHMPMGPGGAASRAHNRSVQITPEDPRAVEQRSRLLAADSAKARALGSEQGRLSFRSMHRPRFASTTAAPTMPMGPGGAASAADPVQIAERETGVDARFIGALVGHESGGVADAKNPNSTATGHGQFIESTWKRMMRDYGPRYGLSGDLSNDQVLELRNDPQWSALMIGHYAEENAAELRGRLGRGYEPSHADTYLAHFLGPADAADLIGAARRGQGNRPARGFVSAAVVEANRSIFIGPGGRARTVEEVRQLQGRNFRYEGGGGSIRARASR